MKLRCQCVPQDASQRPRLAVVLCHGYGAPGSDLVPLAGELLAVNPRLKEGVQFIFPEAPISLEASGGGNGRAWWNIDLNERIRLQALGTDGELALHEQKPEGLPEARRMLMGLLEGVARQTGLGLSRIVLGGFSQGAMVATDVALALDEAPAGLVILSGTLISRPDWEKKAARRRGLPVLQSHGRMDPTLSFAGGEALQKVLEQAGLAVQVDHFNGGHTIARSTLTALGRFLEGLLGAG